MRIFLTLGLWLALAGGVWAEASGVEEFKRGVAQFKLPDYEQALIHFLKARELGVRSATLDYNLGATYYKLGRYQEAQAEFERLLAHKEAAGLAHYNLGLTHLRRKNNSVAAQHFEQAVRLSGDQNLKRLATAALNRVRPKQQPSVAAKASRLKGLISVGGGYDDNVTQSADTDQLRIDNSEAAFYESLAVGQLQLRGDRSHGERLTLTGFVRRHDDADRFDQSLVQADISVDRKLGSWYTSLGLGGDVVYLDDDRFTTTGTVSLEGLRSLTKTSSIGLRYRGSYIDGADDFESVTGQRHALRTTLTKLWPSKQQTQLSYEAEFNNRRDSSANVVVEVAGEPQEFDQFFSRSPFHHTVLLSHRVPVTDKFSLTPQLEYRYSRYQHEESHLFVEESEVEGEGATLGIDDGKRKDRRWRAILRAEYKLINEFFLHGQYEYTDHKSNFDEFEYDRSAVSAGLGANF